MFDTLRLAFLLLGSLAVLCGGEMPIARVIRQIAFPGSQGFVPSVPQGFPSATQGSRNTLQNVPQGCRCVPIISCPSALNSPAAQGCSLPDATSGVCCPSTESAPPWGGITRLFSPVNTPVPVPPISADQVNSACQHGLTTVNNISIIETRIMNSNQVLPKGTPADGHLKFFEVKRTARDTHRMAMSISEASGSMMKDFRLTQEQGCRGLRQFPVRNTILSRNCPSMPVCNNAAKYRTIDGSCNNLRHPLWGKSETAFQRIVPAKYDDGIHAPRTRSVAGGTLPNVRRISNNVLLDIDNPDPTFTISVMQWGQFVDHDLTHAPFASFENNAGKECCRDGQLVQPQLLPDCWPIEIPPEDEFYARRNQRCMNFVRSMLAEDEECTFGCSEQMNQVTHWLDGSNIYGSTKEESDRIRDFSTGLLLLSANGLLPFQTQRSRDCAAARGTPCFMAGDSRVNEQPALTAIHTIWHREHNRVAQALRQVNPQWSPEAVYQEARRIVVAEYQHIVYNEWLPIVVGEAFMRSFDIMPRVGGSFSQDYNPNINPNMNNEFATGAFRFGHTLVQGTMSLFSGTGRQGALRLKDHFNSPHLFHSQPELVDMFARTFARQSIQQFDSFITRELTNHLFETAQADFGMDLMSLNLHRGRDHAIATYNEIRVVCGLPRARSFADLQDQIPPQTVQRLAATYRHVDDIDFFVGGISERPVSGGLLGWTFLCVVGDQFARARKGDRFFYDLGGQPSSFRPDQLDQIRRASWARILCDNSLTGNVQPLAFRLSSALNRETPCNGPQIPKIDLRLWAGEPARA